MVFSSLYFLLYFLPAFLLFYYLSPRSLKNAVALIASCFFYAWGEPEFIFVVFTSLILDFYLVQLMHLSEGKRKRQWLWTSLILNIGLLLGAKYLNFFVDNINVFTNIFGAKAIHLQNIMLPIGISFISFQKISYVLDCYQKRSKPLYSFVDYALYILFFPQLIAGPIVRFNEIADQLKDRRANETIDNKINGFFRFIIGLSKKVLIANSLGLFVDQVFATAPETMSSFTVWMGMLAYALQIYFDFSGYSDMAIGLALMLGFRFPENFNFPYIAQSITDFWRRWHITLSKWMRDYLYIPLGGNRVSTSRLYLNLWIVFLISGFWHGAAWTFIFWGVFHGFFLILDRLFLLRFLKRIGKIPAVFFTFFIVLIGWVFFRSGSFNYAFSYIGQLFSFQSGGLDFFVDGRFWWSLILGLLFSFSALFSWVESLVNRLFIEYTQLWVLALKSLVSLLLGLICLMDIYASGFNPFIYFQF